VNVEHLRDADPAMPDLGDDRATDNWRPLIAIADLIGSDWARKARDAAVCLTSGRATDDLPEGVRLLHDIKTVFQITRVRTHLGGALRSSRKQH
jgi:hypothetical protein